MILVSFQSAADQDLFYHRAAVPAGWFKGQKIDVSKKRAVVILEDTPYARIYGLEADSTLVGNVYHNGKFYVARIPKNSVQKTYFSSEPFGGVFAHSMLHFEFPEEQSKQIKLISEIPTEEEASQRKAGKEIQPIYLQDLLISAEVSMREGEGLFSPIRSFFHLNGMVYRVISLTGRGTKPYLEHKKKVFETALNLNKEESNKALESSLRTSHEAGMCTMYNTVAANCNIYVFRLLYMARELLSDSHSLLENTKGAILLLLNEAGVLTRVWPSLGKTGLFWRGFVDLNGDKGALLNDNERFRKMAQEYECEKALGRESEL